MFSIHDRGYRLCDGITRRELLRVGGLTTLGLSLPTLLGAKALARPLAADESGSATFGRAKNVIYLWLQGGPPQHETFDPKPEAPAEIRGEFSPIATNVPGIQFSELLPRTAAIADKLAIVRSLSTHSDLHDASGYWILTGYKYLGRESRQIDRPRDWPYLGSVIRRLAPSPTLPSYTSVWLPDVMRLNDNVQPAGQTAGFLGVGWDPQRVICDPSDPNFQIEGLTLPAEIPALRLASRQSLLSQVERHFEAVERGPTVGEFDRQTNEAFGLLTSGQARQAFDLSRETPATRERYGRHKWGQCVLLARRLVEAGARLVHVNWPREGGDEAVNNPMWDTHAQNADRLQDVLCPQFDVTFTALIDDLDQRGLLAETLVVVIGEFGRTPKINSQGGRDHWGHVFSFALAGAGIRGAQVYGSSDKHGAYPRDGRLEPQDLTATILHLLGIGHQATFPDATGRPYHATFGEPIAALLGSSPATDARVLPEGNLALVPPYTTERLRDGDFEDGRGLSTLDTQQRLKGWRAQPVAQPAPNQFEFGAQIASGNVGRPYRGSAQAVMGLGATKPTIAGTLAAGARILLTQELRNPRAGTYTISLYASAGGVPADWKWFAANFSCRLLLLGYQNLAKNPVPGFREFASTSIDLASLGESAPYAYRPFTLTRKLRSQEGGAAEIEMGVGVAVLVERTAPGELVVPAGLSAFVQIDDVALGFIPRPRNDDVMV
ncbi:MAG: DUF1501 domain-containing protein [Planctomycetaceae bacterium]|nr:DUF1501 domain-containing protein [Planctomycetaceae bacterium]